MAPSGPGCAERITSWWGVREPLSSIGSAGAAFEDAVDAGLLDLPRPGAGATDQRFAALAALGDADVALARLAEAHADALAVLDELGGPPPPARSRWAVWAAEPPSARLTAAPSGTGWFLSGTKAWCSGARLATHALVTAEAPNGSRLFALDLADPGVHPVPGSWHGVALTAVDTLTVGVDHASALPVGDPGDYLDRRGFWSGAVGVAACWYGGARAVARPLLDAAARRPDPHLLAHLGAVDVAISGARALLDRAATDIDAHPDERGPRARRRAEIVRGAVERAATETLERVARALGPGPLATDPAHARRVVDLPVYLRQHHAERDLAVLGQLAAEQGTDW